MTRVLIVGALTALGCNRTSENELIRPLFATTSHEGWCDSSVALDGELGIWTEGGCEGDPIDFRLIDEASAAEAERVRTAFSALPLEQDPSCGDRVLGVSVSLRRATAESDVRWLACLDEAGRPVAPYAEAVAALRFRAEP